MSSGFGQFCPIAVACEIFAERWTPMILRELLAGSEHFNEIHRGVPLMSRALLSRRLRDLAVAGVITRETPAGRRGSIYRLTPAGEEFRPAIEALGRWGQRWTIRVQRGNLDAGLLVWNMRRRIDCSRLPPGRVVAHLHFIGVPRTYRGARAFWLLMERTGVDVCVDDPGYEPDLRIEADLASFARVWLGDLDFDTAVRAKDIRLDGPRRLTQGFPTWLMLSHFAGVARPEAGDALVFTPARAVEATGARATRRREHQGKDGS